MIKLIYYLGFFIVSWFVLMFIFRFSTYHKFFKYSAPALILYGILVAFLLFQFELHQFYLWHIGINTIFLYNGYRKQKKLSSIINITEDRLERAELELSMERTFKYYILSSVIYLLTFTVSYLYFFNS